MKTGEHIHVDKLDILALHDLSSPLENLLVALRSGARHKLLLKATRLDVVHHLQQRRDTRCVAGQLHDFPVREHDATKGVRS